MSVPDIEYLIKIPDNMSLSVAAMLPSGALWALNTVQQAESAVQRITEKKGPNGTVLFELIPSKKESDCQFQRYRYVPHFGSRHRRSSSVGPSSGSLLFQWQTSPSPYCCGLSS